MGLPTTRPRVAHAHPLTPDARASRAAVAFRAADRAGRRRHPPRLRVPLPAVLVVAVALLIGGQPATQATVPGRDASDRSGAMDLADRRGQDSTAVDATANPVPAHTTAASYAGRPAIDGILAGYRWPLEHARITQAFGPSRGGLFIVAGKEFHDGIDIANFCGAPVLAAHDGTVIGASRRVVSAMGWIGDLAAYEAYVTKKGLWGAEARTVVIDDGNGYRSVYLHFWRIDVHVGQVVRAGEQIGLEGSSGHATGCHLHYSLYRTVEPVTWKTNPDDVERNHLPPGEIARIDPLSVLPPLAVGWITWGWGAKPPTD